MSLTQKIRGVVKTGLLDLGTRLTNGGHPVLGAIASAPVRTVRWFRTRLDAPRRGMRRQWLKATGRWVVFLRPYWHADELRIGSASAPNDDAAALETAFLEGFPPNAAAIATSSGRTALRLALRILMRRHPERTEVVIPSYACPAVLLPILECGLKPVLIDIEESSLNASAASFAPHLGPETLAVVPVHLGGRQMDAMGALIESTHRAGASVIEDVCQATGGRDANGPWGRDADFAIHSFGIGKAATGTAGGMLIARERDATFDKEVARLTTEPPTLVATRFAYMRRRFFPAFPGPILPPPKRPRDAFYEAYNDHRMADLDARLVLRQVKRLGDILARRARNAQVLVEAVRSLSSIRIAGTDGPNTWTKCTAVAESDDAARRILAHLHAEGIETEAMYTPLHLMPEGKPFGHNGLSVSEALHRRVFCLPVRPDLTETQMRRIARVLRDAATGATS